MPRSATAKRLWVFAKRNRGFIKVWLRHNGCAFCGKGRHLVVSRLDGRPVKVLVYLSPESLRRYLSECCALCRACKSRKANGVTEETFEQIRNSLLSFERVRDIRARFGVWKGTVAMIAEQMQRNGQVCLCGKRLGHRSQCSLVQRARSCAPVPEVRPNPATPAKPMLVRDSAGCKADFACPWPPVHDGLCRHHAQSFAFAESMTDRTLDMEDFISSEENPNPLLSVVTFGELRNPRFREYRRVG
ncbi:MAG TPA: hypothetical protein VKW06_08955 [Candidatus Angelobacter sp.]|nr:hypothetical protein [Candidatus Angelobacter sp.]